MARRRRWGIAGGLLVLAGLGTAAATWRHWARCRPDVSAPACLALQDDTYGPPLWSVGGQPDAGGLALVAASALLATLAWVLVVDWARVSSARVVVAGIVGAQPLLVAALVGLELVRPGPTLLEVGGWLTWPAEIVVLPMLLGAGWILDEAPVQILRLMLLAWAVTSFGPVHHFVDYAVSAARIGGASSTPPGLGYVTAGGQLVLGLAVALVSLLVTEPGQEEDDRAVRPSGSPAVE
jgi:hypothetical protein